MIRRGEGRGLGGEGDGGGTIGAPTMRMVGTPIRRAAATASAFGIVISIPATLITIAGGCGDPRMPPYSLGDVNLIGFVLIASGSILAAPGVRITPMPFRRCSSSVCSPCF